MTDRDVPFEEALSDTWDDEDRGVAEVPLDDRALTHVGLVMLAIGLVIAGRVFYLNAVKGSFYAPRAEANLGYRERVPAPRGVIVDRFGAEIAENRAVFSALLDVREFLRRKDLEETTLAAISRILGISADEVWQSIQARDLERSVDPIPLVEDITQQELVAIREAQLPTLKVENSFARAYPGGPAFSSLLGYVGLPTNADLTAIEGLTGREEIGKTGIEQQYDDLLRGTAGVHRTLRDAHGAVLGEEEETMPKIGGTLKLSIDAEFQKYFYARFEQGLTELGRTAGGALAIDPRNGAVLALMSFPSFDNSVFASADALGGRSALLNDPDRPLFNRVVSGVYSPGSSIKPLVGVAALTEGVITPSRTIFSPGYIDIPNPYHPSEPTRFLDWRYQGDVNLAAAIAQSSNVYFYLVGGGGSGIKGLGIDRLRAWWEKFGLGKKTGIDMPGEAQGFLPSIEWKEKQGSPWVLGDTYHAAIGQGDLQITPLQLLAYIAGIANGGTIYAPHVNADSAPVVNADLTSLKGAIGEVQKGMRTTVTSALGTAHLLDDLPFASGAKTGSAQVKNNAEENAFFVGYAPFDNPQIAILVLVENAKQGSLNAVPIAKDVLAWYYEHRMKQ